jgi:hypothetical protein
MVSAVVQNNDETVINIIVADPAIDPAPEGCTLIALPEGSPVTFGWIYNPSNGTFTDPNLPAPEPTARAR